jgi:hypothetical protein
MRACHATPASHVVASCASPVPRRGLQVACRRLRADARFKAALPAPGTLPTAAWHRTMACRDRLRQAVAEHHSARLELHDARVLRVSAAAPLHAARLARRACSMRHLVQLRGLRDEWRRGQHRGARRDVHGRRRGVLRQDGPAPIKPDLIRRCHESRPHWRGTGPDPIRLAMRAVCAFAFALNATAGPARAMPHAQPPRCAQRTHRSARADSRRRRAEAATCATFRSRTRS